MRTVFTGSEVPHIFASRSQESGRNSTGSLSFEGKTLRSYREPIARFWDQNTVLVSSDKFSVTTSKHQAWASYALNHFDKIRLPDLDTVCLIIELAERGTEWSLRDAAKHAAQYIQARSVIIALIKAKQARRRCVHKAAADRAEVASLEEACAFVWKAAGKKSSWLAADASNKREERRARRVALAVYAERAEAAASERAEIAIQKLWDTLREPDVARCLHRRRRVVQDTLNRFGWLIGDGAGYNTPYGWRPWTKNEEAEARRLMGVAWADRLSNARYMVNKALTPVRRALARVDEEIARVDLQNKMEALTGWLEGRSNRVPRLRQVFCRVVGEEVQTTRGARVPLRDAVRVVRLAAECRRDRTWLWRETFAAGSYRGITVCPQGNVTIGCHSLPWESIALATTRFMPELAKELGIEPPEFPAVAAGLS